MAGELAGPIPRQLPVESAAGLGIGTRDRPGALHFVGMLAFELPITMGYEFEITALSC